MAASTKPIAFVVDSSAMVARLFPDEKTTSKFNAAFTALHQGSAQFYAPLLLKYEVTNAIKTGILRHRFTATISQKLLKQFLALPIKYQPTNFPLTLKLATKYYLSVYDATYLHLAKSQKAPLLSLDTPLTKLALS